MTTMPFARLRLTSQQFVNPRQTSGLTLELISELGIHIGLHGLMTPLLVTADGLIIAGQRRYRAIEWILEWFTGRPKSATVDFKEEEPPETKTLHIRTTGSDEHGDGSLARPYRTIQGIRELSDKREPQFVDITATHARERSSFTNQFGEAGAGLSHEEVSIIERRANELASAVPVRVIGGAGLEGVALADNVLREQLSSYEIAAHLAHLHEQGATGVELARLVGKSRTYISRKLTAFRGAGPELRQAWERGELAEDHVQQIAELSHAQQAHELAGDERPKRGPAHRPGIDSVKDVLDALELAGHQTNNPRLEVGNARYAAGAVDALRWVTGKQTSEAFAKLLQEDSSDRG